MVQRIVAVLALLAAVLSVPAATQPQAYALSRSVAHCQPGDCGSLIVAPVSDAPPSTEPCTSKEKVVCQIREMTPVERLEARDIRMGYHGLLEGMRATEAGMRRDGASDEQIARRLVDLRNEAKRITRAGMSPEAVERLEERNRQKYGNPLGPTADQLYVKYGSWSEVIASARRTSPAVDSELGLKYRPCPV